MNYGAYTCTVPNVQRHRAKFLVRKPQLRLHPHYSQPRALYRMSNNPDALNSSYPAEKWSIGRMIINRIRPLFNWIRKMVDLFKSRINEQLGPYGFSPFCICAGITTTLCLIASGLGLGIGLGLAVHNYSITSLTIGNSTVTVNSASTVGVSLYFYFLLILLGSW